LPPLRFALFAAFISRYGAIAAILLILLLRHYVIDAIRYDIAATTLCHAAASLIDCYIRDMPLRHFFADDADISCCSLFAAIFAMPGFAIAMLSMPPDMPPRRLFALRR